MKLTLKPAPSKPIRQWLEEMEELLKDATDISLLGHGGSSFRNGVTVAVNRFQTIMREHARPLPEKGKGRREEAR